MDPKKNLDNNNKNKSFIYFILVSIVFTLLLNSLLSGMASNTVEEIDYNVFLQWVEKGYVQDVSIREDRLVVLLKPEEEMDGEMILDDQESQDAADGTQEDGALLEGQENSANPSSALDRILDSQQSMMRQALSSSEKIYYTGNMNDPGLVDMLQENGVSYRKYVENTNPFLSFFTSWILPCLIIYGIFSLFMGSVTKKMGGRGGIMSVGQSNAKVYIEKKTGISFDDVAGQEEAKESLMEIVDFLHNPDKYTRIGAKQPKGALLVGSPGTGKTLLAKAVAGEADVAFFSISGSDFVEMFVGVGASRVRDLFKQASQHAPCIIFIDEIDAIGKSRDSALGGNDEREQTLNQLLAEMDGFDSSKGVVILGATNRPDVLDKALLRPGRFDRRIIVDKPDLKGREEILKVHSKKVILGKDVDLKQIALATSGAAGADLANMVNEAALRAVRLERQEVLQEDLMEAVEIIVAGKEKKDRILTPKEKRIVAFHEVGHALAAAMQKNAQPVQKITIVPRTMGALGYTMQMPEEERYLMTRDEIIEQITIFLGGRCAEELVFQLSTTGAANDIERATKLARNMVAQYGMSEKFGMMGIESIESKYLDGRSVSNCSDQTNADVDAEVMRILKECHDKAYQILKENEKALHKISEHLIEKETILGEEFISILNEFLDEKIELKKEEENK